MGLVLKETMCLSTPNGTSEIQLLFGDITKLTMKDKVDIVFTSAFPGDYTMVPGTMVYALNEKLGIKMNALAKDKALDLRRTLNCWVSKPLPPDVPYKRLACFERMNHDSVIDQISGIFRGMMPVFNNEETSVITPLLASGNQGHSEVKILKAITTAACHWIKAGLPLKCLKIVVYASNLARLSNLHKVLLDVFCQLKSAWEKNKDEEQLSKSVKKYDVCLSFSAGDEALVAKVCSALQEQHASIVIHKELLIFDHDEVWQKEVFSIMVQSRRIVTVLTPAYVDDPECLEQYNLALCCNRLTGVEMLAPFYIMSIQVFPSYMTIIQYTDCRVRKPGDKTEDKIIHACSLLVTALDKEKETISNTAVDTASETSAASASASKGSVVYDVFISYAHKSSTEAVKMYDNLLDIEPNLKVFLDRSELRTGNSWQEALYDSVDTTKVMIAFITKHYINSTVCQEEYNIALARYLMQDGIYFVPLLIDTDIAELPSMYSGVPLVDMKNPSQRLEEQYYDLAEAPIRWLRAMEKGIRIVNVFCQPAQWQKTRISFVTVKWREADFDQRFKYKGTKCVEMIKTCADEMMEAECAKATKQVVFSCTKSCFSQAALLARYLMKQTKVKVTCEFLTSPEDDAAMKTPNLQLLDSADMVLVLMSNDYMISAQHRHELHIALCRQRMCKDKRVVYLIKSNHSQKKPVYAHLLHNTISLDDEFWRSVARVTHCSDTHFMIQLPGLDRIDAFCSGEEQQALTTASLDIVDKLIAGSQAPGGSGMPTNIVNLVDMRNGNQSIVSASELLVDFAVSTGTEKDSGFDSADVATLLPDPPTHAPAEDQVDDAAGKESKGIPSGKQDENKSAQGEQDNENSAGKQKVECDKENPPEKQDTKKSAQEEQDNENSAGKQKVEHSQAKPGTGKTAGANKPKVTRKSSACQVM